MTPQWRNWGRDAGGVSPLPGSSKKILYTSSTLKTWEKRNIAWESGISRNPIGINCTTRSTETGLISNWDDGGFEIAGVRDSRDFSKARRKISSPGASYALYLWVNQRLTHRVYMEMEVPDDGLLAWRDESFENSDTFFFLLPLPIPFSFTKAPSSQDAAQITWPYYCSFKIKGNLLEFRNVPIDIKILWRIYTFEFNLMQNYLNRCILSRPCGSKRWIWGLY